MSREVSISYELSDGTATIDIEVRPPYFLLGTQHTSEQFWSLPRLREVGLMYLVDLGELDPIYFVGWDMLEELRREIELLQKHLTEIDFDADIKATWLSHLVYCHSLLVCTAPPGSIPRLTIG